MAERNFKLKKEEVIRMPEWGGGCIATDRITVDGARVGYMYREGANNNLDSGWRFFAGDEDETYLNDVTKRRVYRVDTIINYDPGIVGYLDAPEGSRLELNSDGCGINS